MKFIIFKIIIKKKEKILIAVKTYPVPSKKYTEVACTAGFRSDGSWIRIYPIPFRLLEKGQQFHKYQWIELELTKNSKDSRPESYNPINRDEIVLCELIDTENEWTERRRIILQQNRVYTNMTQLIQDAKNDICSLAIFKPTKILDFISKPTTKEWRPDQIEAMRAQISQLTLFEADQRDFKEMPKLPYKFSYKFIDDKGRKSTLMIEDWEIGQLYWNCVKNDSEKVALEKVKQKYLDDFAKTKDLYLFLSTTLQFHKIGLNPFIVIGTFHPPHIIQNSLF